MSVRVMTIGELTVDAVVFEDGECQWKQVGGGALYSALGARAWDADVAISATVGGDFPIDALGAFSDAGLDTSGLTRIDAPSLGLWLLYEHGGRRHQVPKESGSTFAHLDEARRPWTAVESRVDGIHIAPQTAEGQARTLQEAANRSVVVTQDLLIEPFVTASLYSSGEALTGTTAFLPSAQEVAQLWPDLAATELLRDLQERAGIRHLVIKRGAAGADVVFTDGVVRVPAVNMRALDPTGAGDAFCGGFLVGLVATGDPVDAAVYGVVSASFVVETRGALEALQALDPREARRRADKVRTAMEVQR